MLFSPAPLGNIRLAPEVLAEDKKKCLKIGPCGLGEKAIYLNSFFIDRRYYAAWEDVRRVWKRVAMSKGGFTGKGVFGSIPYLVVRFSDGSERQFNFKFEPEVDAFLAQVNASHPDIPTLSVEGEKKLREAKEAEEARYVKELSPEAEKTLSDIRAMKAFFEEKPEISANLSLTARQKRVIDNISPYYRLAAAAIFLLALGAAVFGLISVLRGSGMAVYFVLFGLAFMFFAMSTRVLPTGRNNRRAANEEWEEAVRRSKAYLEGMPACPIPPQYAHPKTADRLIRVIREGRAVTFPEAWRIMKEELKALNSGVTVTQTEYDEVVAIKPMFLICNYED